MAKRFYLSEKQNIKLDIPKKYQSILGVDSLRSAAAQMQIQNTSESNGKNFSSRNKKSRSKKNVRKKSGFDLNSFVRVVATVLIFCSLAVLSEYARGYSVDIEYNKAQKELYEITFESENKNQSVTATMRPTPVYPLEENDDGSRKYDYPKPGNIEGIKRLGQDYEDFMYWLYLADTPISYPVVQADDNDYYLRRDMDGKENLSGTLFLDYRNEPEMEYGNNIVYGHNMQNGTMFGGLKKYRDREYFDKHQMIYTYTSDEATAWKIFSVYETTTENYYIRTNFVNKDDYFEFISGLQRNSIHKTNVALESSSTVLTLSTCHKYDYDNGRFVVHAVKMFTAPLV